MAVVGTPLGVLLWLFSDRSAIPFVVIIVVLATLFLGVQVVQQRTERLAVRGGNLTYTTWRGRTETVPRWDMVNAVYVTVLVPSRTGARPEARLVGVRASAPPFMTGPTMLHAEDVGRLLAGFGVQMFAPPEKVKIKDLPARIPGLRLPFQHRRPGRGEPPLRRLRDRRARPGSSRGHGRGVFHQAVTGHGAPATTETVYRAGRFTLSRFLPSFERDHTSHVGETVADDRGALVYMKALPLSAALARRSLLGGTARPGRLRLVASAGLRSPPAAIPATCLDS